MAQGRLKMNDICHSVIDDTFLYLGAENETFCSSSFSFYTSQMTFGNALPYIRGVADDDLGRNCSDHYLCPELLWQLLW